MLLADMKALQRITASFPAEIQSGICAQLADCLVAVISQRLQFRSDLKIQAPECEVLMPIHAVKNFIRRGEFFKMMSCMETGADQGMWTYARYRTWLDAKSNWYMPGSESDDEIAGDLPPTEEAIVALPPVTARTAPQPVESPVTSSSPARPKSGRLEIEPEEGGLNAIISKLKEEE